MWKFAVGPICRTAEICIFFLRMQDVPRPVTGLPPGSNSTQMEKVVRKVNGLKLFAVISLLALCGSAPAFASGSNAGGGKRDGQSGYALGCFIAWALGADKVCQELRAEK